MPPPGLSRRNECLASVGSLRALCLARPPVSPGSSLDLDGTTQPVAARPDRHRMCPRSPNCAHGSDTHAAPRQYPSAGVTALGAYQPLWPTQPVQIVQALRVRLKRLKPTRGSALRPTETWPCDIALSIRDPRKTARVRVEAVVEPVPELWVQRVCAGHRKIPPSLSIAGRRIPAGPGRRRRGLPGGHRPGRPAPLV